MSAKNEEKINIIIFLVLLQKNSYEQN